MQNQEISFLKTFKCTHQKVVHFFISSKPCSASQRQYSLRFPILHTCCSQKDAVSDTFPGTLERCGFSGNDPDPEVEVTMVTSVSSRLSIQVPALTQTHKDGPLILYKNPVNIIKRNFGLLFFARVEQSYLHFNWKFLWHSTICGNRDCPVKHIKVVRWNYIDPQRCECFA